eukprot:CAMPEP_0174695262 /NCGR_PEP_ID=MMETSP1094-20130205/1676_1 /TAXON_ID=156173 /ORGANISM="Chrysochromulina brevifilum, Strain UTEX LB 985" /LENGTH=100 /DNA_ID=CAMNT_0015891715 /DNA_START=1 /DNA_END=300 /DNA_ORIENTATION=-
MGARARMCKGIWRHVHMRMGARARMCKGIWRHVHMRMGAREVKAMHVSECNARSARHSRKAASEAEVLLESGSRGVWISSNCERGGGVVGQWVKGCVDLV